MFPSTHMSQEQKIIKPLRCARKCQSEVFSHHLWPHCPVPTPGRGSVNAVPLPALWPTRPVYKLLPSDLETRPPPSGEFTWAAARPCPGLCACRKPDVKLAYGGASRKYSLSGCLFQFLSDSVILLSYLASRKDLCLPPSGQLN